MHASRPAALVVATLASALVLTGVQPAPAHAVTSDRPWVGFRIAADGTAGGSWVGARRTTTRKVYRIDPAGKPSTAGFWAPQVRTVLNSPGDDDRLDVLRAAWILGARTRDGRVLSTKTDPFITSAVEVSLHHLLKGGKYRIDGTATARRLRQTGYASSIKRLATTLVRDSLYHAGPYRLTVGGTGTVVGGDATVRARLTTARKGTPVRDWPVRVKFDGQEPVDLRTDADGRVSMAFRANDSGEMPVTVTALGLPATDVLVRRPKTAGASRILIAGRRTHLTQRSSLPVQARPALSVTPRSVAVTRTTLPGGSFGVAAAEGTLRATVGLHGPFPTPEAAHCESTPVTTATVAVDGNGTFALPPVNISRYGFYTWRVSTAANRHNVAASTCSGSTKAVTQPAIKLTRNDDQIALGGSIFARASVTNLPDAYEEYVLMELFGPFSAREDVTCAATKRVYERRVIFEGPYESNAFPSYQPAKVGYYAWRTTVRSSEFSRGAQTTCAQAGSVVRVVPAS